MKYIATIEKMKHTNKISIYLDTKNKTFIVKIKETGKRMVYDIRLVQFLDLGENYNFHELTLLHTYFLYNKEEFNRLLNLNTEENIDFLNDNNLKLPEGIDYEDSNSIYKLNDLMSTLT